MPQRFPESIDGFVDPWQDCSKGREYHGAYPLSEFDRLTPLLASLEGEAAFALRFGQDDDRRPVITGRVNAELSLVCQRCLHAMALSVSSEVALSPVSGLEESARLPESLDPLLVADGTVRLRDIVEDELIVAVPVIARHGDSECQLSIEPVSDGETQSQRAESPFAVLASLKKSGDDEKR